VVCSTLHLTVPTPSPLKGVLVEQVSVPVRAWALASVSLAYEGARCEEGCTQWAASAVLGDGRSLHPGTLAAALEFTYKQFANPILALLSADLRARVFIEKG
jgi:hypothetical protein